MLAALSVNLQQKRWPMRFVILPAAFLILSVGALRADWPQFRGKNSAGIAEGPAAHNRFRTRHQRAVVCSNGRRALVALYRQ